MKQPNRVLLVVVALAALLPHTSRLLPEDSAPVLEAPVATNPAAPAAVKAIKTQPLLTENSAAPPIARIPAAEEPLPEQQAIHKQEVHPWDVLPIAEPESFEDPLAGLEEAYMVEAFDADWAMPIEANFHKVVETARLFDTDIEQAECRTTLCRFAVVHKNAAAKDAFVQAFLQSPLLPLSQGSIAHHSHTTKDGGISAVYFLARNEVAQLQN